MQLSKLPEFDRPEARRPFRVFIVTTNEHNRFHVGFLFENAGCQCESFESAAELIPNLNTDSVGVAFCDWDCGAEDLMRSVRTNRVPLAVVPLSQPSTQYLSVKACRRGLATEFLLRSCPLLGFDAFAAARRAYCQWYQLQADLDLRVVQHQMAVGLDEEILQRFKHLLPNERKAVNLLAQGFDNYTIMKRLRITKAEFEGLKARARRYAGAHTIPCLIRHFLAFKARGGR